MNTIVHVHLIHGRKDYYFGSISAIYSVLTEEEIGFSLSYLRHARLGAVIGKKAIIKRSEVICSPRRSQVSHNLYEERREKKKDHFPDLTKMICK